MNSRFVLSLFIISIMLTACFLMAFGIRDGLPVNPDVVSRMSFINQHHFIWHLNWLFWMSSALGLLLFCCFLLDFIPESPFKLYGILLVACGIPLDLFAEVIYSYVLPDYALSQKIELFLLLENLASKLTGLLANGFYNLGGLILTLLLLKNMKLPKKLIWFGIPAWVLGLLLSVCMIFDWHIVAAIITAIAMTLSMLWLFAVTLIVYQNERAYKFD